MFTWSYENIKKLIEAFKKHEILWDTSLKEYKNKTLKNEAWNSIAKKFNLHRVEVETKMHSLRSQFAREHKKILSGNKDGKLWFGYDMLKFLLKQCSETDHEEITYEIDEDSSNNKFFEQPQVLVEIKHESLRSSESGDDPLNNDLSQSPSPQNSLAIPSRKRKYQNLKGSKNRRNKSSDRYSPGITNIDGATRDDITIFGEYLMSELRKVKDEHSLIVAKNKISNIIFDAQIGKYKSENGRNVKASVEDCFSEKC